MQAGRLHCSSFIDPRGLGTLVGSDSGVLLEGDPDTVREPDIAYFTVEWMRLPLDVRTSPGYAEVAARFGGGGRLPQ